MSMMSPAALQPAIRSIQETRLIGLSLPMSLSENKIPALWSSFMPRRGEVQAVDADLYSVEVYPDLSSFQAFTPATVFTKWAAVKVDAQAEVPAGMSELVIPAGDYAVFAYKGLPSQAGAFYQRIFRDWLPSSGYQVADRPHFAIMGSKYRVEHPESEEELWVPVVAEL